MPDQLSDRDFAIVRSRDGGRSLNPQFRSQDYGNVLRTIANGSGLRISRLAISPTVPDTLYVAASDANDTSTGDAVYRSLDGAATWQRVLPMGDHGRVGQIVPAWNDPSVIFVATTARIVVSRDGGSTWDVTTSDMTPNETCDLHASTSFLAVGDDTHQLWRATACSGSPNPGRMYASHDGGTTWTDVLDIHTATPYFLVGGRGPQPERLYLADAPVQTSETTDALRPARLYRSDDGGATWSVIFSPPSVPYLPQITALAYEPLHPDTVYVRTTDHSVAQVSHDGGTAWEDVMVDGTPADVVYLADDEAALYAIAQGVLYRQTLSS